MARLCVCIPTWNGANYLPRMLHCLLAQRDVDLTIIVGDDASSDDTVEVARSFSDPRISVRSFPDHVGLAGNWNRMLDLADGDYVAIVGQDDEVRSTWAARLVGLLESYPQADLAFGRRLFALDDRESQIVSTFFKRTYPKILARFYSRITELISPKVMVEEAYRYFFEINLIGEPTFAVIRRKSPAIADGFDTQMTQRIDWEFFTRFFAGQPILHCPEILGTYHIHARSTSIANARFANHRREYNHLLAIVMQRFGTCLGPTRLAKLERRRAKIAGRFAFWPFS